MRIPVLLGLALVGLAPVSVSPSTKALPGESPVVGELSLVLRSRQKMPEGHPETFHREATWKASETAVIVCDMWDLHHCRNATLRVGELAPRLDRFLKEVRRRGATIIHAPSSCTSFYEDHPARRRAKEAPKAKSHPGEIGQWCHSIPAEKGLEFPVDHSDGGCDSTGELQEAFARELAEKGRNPGAPWKRQIDRIEIQPTDFISDDGHEIWNVLEARGIQNVLLTGVHTNMCVLGRPFGLRQMARNGKNVALVRDLTDTMYNPARRPHLDHFRGTDRVVEYIEKVVAPTITSDQILGGEPFRFEGDRKNPKIVFVIAEREYLTRRSLPEFAAKHLETRGYACSFVQASPEDRHDFPGLGELRSADLLVLSVRRRALPEEQLEIIRAHLEAGKPLVALRTSSHAFGRDPKKKGEVAWHEFDREILGAHYQGHYGKTRPGGPPTLVHRAKGAGAHPVLEGLPAEPFRVHTTLYKNRDLASDTRVLLLGRIEGQAEEPLAWTRESRGKVFYTSLGGVEDFALEEFNRLLANAIRWVLEK